MDKIALSKKKNITLKRTSTQRSDSSGSESSSPSDKRLRNTKYKDNEGEIQEVFEEAVEVSPAQELDMADKMSEKLDEILGKLNKLDTIESTLNDLCSKMAIVKGDISKLKADAHGTDTKLQQMDESLKWFNKEMEDIKLKTNFLEAAKEDLHTKQLYAEAYSRRENLKFFGLAEKETQGTVSEAINTRELLFEFLKNGLGFEDPEKKFELQRVHRLGKPASGKTRPIIARFLRYQDREMVLRASFHLQDREIRVLEDYPQEIIEPRRKQMSKLKEAKRNGMKVSFSKAEPDKLYINGKFVPA